MKPIDVVKFEKHIFDKHVELMKGVDRVPRDFAKKMSKLCFEMAAIIRADPRDFDGRVNKLRETYTLLREYGYDLPN